MDTQFTRIGSLPKQRAEPSEWLQLFSVTQIRPENLMKITPITCRGRTRHRPNPALAPSRWVLPSPGEGGRRPRERGPRRAPDGYHRCPATWPGPSQTMGRTLSGGGHGQGSVGSVGEATAREPSFTPTSLFSQVVAPSHPQREKEDGPLLPSGEEWGSPKCPRRCPHLPPQPQASRSLQTASFASSPGLRPELGGFRGHTPPRVPFPGKDRQPPLHAPLSTPALGPGTPRPRREHPRALPESPPAPPGRGASAPRRPPDPDEAARPTAPRRGPRPTPRAPPPRRPAAALPAEKGPRDTRAAGGANAGSAPGAARTRGSAPGAALRVCAGCACGGCAGPLRPGPRRARGGRGARSRAGGRLAAATRSPPPGPAAALAPPRAPRRPRGSAPGPGGGGGAGGAPPAPLPPRPLGSRRPPLPPGWSPGAPAALLPTLSRAETAPLSAPPIPPSGFSLPSLC
uniref:basic proline-rich protein-like n=1 Tax=Panthera onca TaxID=9690 RepID=UPI0029549319|nr:basic proline-rich protein-like [Panthera onca]